MTPEDFKNNGIYKGSTLLYPKKTIQGIIDNLMPTEKIIILTNCNSESHPGVLAVTTNRLVFSSTVLFSTYFKDFDIKKITSLNLESSLISKLTIQSSSDKVVLSALRKEVGQEIVSKIKELQFSPSTTSDAGSQHGLNDLEKLAELKAKGILTEEEFTLKKKQILGI